MTEFIIRLSAAESIAFEGECLAAVQARNHDDTVRRCFRLYKISTGYVAERIDDPGTIDVRFWGERCNDELEVFQFFGTEPLANFLYGAARLEVPGLRFE